MARSRRDSLVVLHAGDDLGGSCCCWARLAGNREDVLVVLYAGDDPKEDGGHECSDLAITATTHQLEKRGLQERRSLRIARLSLTSSMMQTACATKPSLIVVHRRRLAVIADGGSCARTNNLLL